ncbi:MAG: hypothetical protein JXR25_03625 [Pontiellaceae bacterium]|nr:hypothetical protein [Pontiellaceae bacterium]MBN2783891.1 hypothetical protein [Pontiellaceae bacterium]
MTLSQQQWHQVRSGYLSEVEQALSRAPKEERRQILEELEFHLNERFGELSPDNQTFENMRQIISDMGPSDEYAALLGERIPPGRAGFLRSWRALSLVAVPLVLFICVGLFVSFGLRRSGPVVVEVSPGILMNAVDPDICEISVTFDCAMLDNSWSWTGGGEHYPKIIGRPEYDSDCKTCTLPVRLEPGRWYAIGVNSPAHANFRSENKVPADPYLILFATADEDGRPTAIPEDAVKLMKQINSKWRRHG